MLLGTTAAIFSQALAQEAAPEKPLKGTYTYKTVGGLELKCDVFRCPSAQSQPAILWMHGGALMMASRGLLPPRVQLERYLKTGLTFVSIDYRLAPETKLPAIVADVEDAYAWLRAKGPALFNIDPDRIAVMGMSAGAYLAQVAGFRLKPRPKAVISFYGYGDITGAWLTQPNPGFNGTAPVDKDRAHAGITGSALEASLHSGDNGRSDFTNYCRQNGIWTQQVSGHNPMTDKAWFAPYEPHHHVTEDYPPTVLLHGEKDTDVPFAQSATMDRLLTEHQVDHVFVTNPNWGHAFDYGKDDPAIPQAFDRVLDFLKTHLARGV